MVQALVDWTTPMMLIFNLFFIVKDGLHYVYILPPAPPPPTHTHTHTQKY